MADQRHQNLYEFGPFSLDTRERVLLRDGRPLPLKPKVYETLLTLISQSGHVVDKEELSNPFRVSNQIPLLTRGVTPG